MRKRLALGSILLPAAAYLLAGSGAAVRNGLEGWVEGRGWGPIWGPEDQLGALNAMSDESRLRALSLVTEGRAYDLGVTYSRNSFVWPGHNAGEVMTFRSPEGVKRMGDHDFVLSEEGNPSKTAWHSCALFLNDNVATQIDGLGHLVFGDDNRWYNGHTEAEFGGDWGVRACSAAGIPPIVNRAVMLDIAGLKEVDALPGGTAITIADCEAALARQGVEIQVGDVVLLRTGTLRYWGEDGADHEKLAEHDSAGLSLETARWLIEQKGALAIGSDTSGLEVAPPHEGADSFVPVHRYLLGEQGVHILEFHYLEDLARDGVYEFCYIAATNKIAGTTAGFAMRPIAMR
ncbi:MAG: cyclase family protein [Planctomycetota bacterium]